MRISLDGIARSSLRARRAGALLGWASVLSSLCTGLAPPAPKAPLSQNAWIDARNVCVFPLSTRGIPAATADLADALTAGLKEDYAFSGAATPVSLDGVKGQACDAVTIDLTDAAISRKRPKLDKATPAAPGLKVARFQVTGHPMLLGKAKLEYNLSAKDAQLDLQRDRQGRSVLVLTRASAGAFRASIAGNDLQSFLQSTAQDVGKKYGFDVQKLKLKMGAPADRTLATDLKVSFGVAGLGGIIHFKGQLVVDNDLGATLTNLRLVGQGPVGNVVVALLGPGMQKYDGERRPLVEFPGRQMALRDVQFKVDDAVHLSAAFGDDPAAKQ